MLLADSKHWRSRYQSSWSHKNWKYGQIKIRKLWSKVETCELIISLLQNKGDCESLPPVGRHLWLYTIKSKNVVVLNSCCKARVIRQNGLIIKFAKAQFLSFPIFCSVIPRLDILTLVTALIEDLFQGTSLFCLSKSFLDGVALCV